MVNGRTHQDAATLTWVAPIPPIIIVHRQPVGEAFQGSYTAIGKTSFRKGAESCPYADSGSSTSPGENPLAKIAKKP